MFYDKRTQRKIQLLNLLIALLILIPILLDFSKGFMMGLNSSVIGFKYGLEESTFQICTVKPDSLQLNHIGTIPSLNLSSDNILYLPASTTPVALSISSVILTGLSFIALICMIIKLVQLIKSVASDGLMNRRNIKRLRLLSYFMITFYLVSYIDSFITTSYYRSHLSLGDNQICYPELSASVTIAFILLLLAEILNIAYKQREELDLTILITNMPIIVNLDVMMAKRKISLNELSGKIDITPANLSILKTGKAKAIRFSTLEAICKELNCQPGDILEYQDEENTI